MFELEIAWQWREKNRLLDHLKAVRVFHGPGEGVDDSRFFAVDRFNDHYWVTEWESPASTARRKAIRDPIITYYQARGAVSIVGVSRPEKGVAPVSQLWFGKMPKGRFPVQEHHCQFLIQLEKTRHPGLFLDHEPLRSWLQRHSQGLRVLNTFAYTGSLSIAALAGGAMQVTTLDLSKNAIEWAKETSEFNGYPVDLASNRFIVGDVFEWLPRLKRDHCTYDCIILDPPSFSHGKKGAFSTLKDLEKLHALAMDCLTPQGILVTSINSANLPRRKYEQDVLSAGRSKKMEFQVLQEISLPETFPTPFGQERYLKGWILRRIEASS